MESERITNNEEIREVEENSKSSLIGKVAYCCMIGAIVTQGILSYVNDRGSQSNQSYQEREPGITHVKLGEGNYLTFFDGEPYGKRNNEVDALRFNGFEMTRDEYGESHPRLFEKADRFFANSRDKVYKESEGVAQDVLGIMDLIP